jgi:RNA polymerase sigma-70 factor (ECF subfamily)
MGGGDDQDDLDDRDPDAENPDAALARRAARGDRAAFEALLRRHYDGVHRLAWRLTGDAALADDIAQQVGLKLAKTIGSFDGRARFGTWLYAVVLNTVRDDGRRRRAEARTVGAYAEIEALRRAEAADTAARRSTALEAVAALSDDLRETVLLVLDGLTHAEVGAVLGVNEGTVSWRLSEVRRRIGTLRETVDG